MHPSTFIFHSLVYFSRPRLNLGVLDIIKPDTLLVENSACPVRVPDSSTNVHQAFASGLVGHNDLVYGVNYPILRHNVSPDHLRIVYLHTVTCHNGQSLTIDCGC